MKTPSQLAAEYYASDMSIEQFARLVQEDALESAAVKAAHLINLNAENSNVYRSISDGIRAMKTEGK